MSGNDEFKLMRPLSYEQKYHACIGVFDICDKDSLQCVKWRLDEFRSQFKIKNPTFIDDLLYYIVGNKCDI